MTQWALRAAWATLPLSAGPAVSDALADWSSGPRIAAAILVWVGWGIGLLASLAPRPVGLTALRTLGPAIVVAAVAIALFATTSTVAAVGALVATVVAAGLAMHPDVAVAAANGIAYGDEQRFPLRTPLPLFFGMLPLARAVAVAGVVTGPLLLAEGDALGSGIALAVGFPAAWSAFRALHTLSRRWLVLVPAGVVIVDPMTLADAVLMPRERIRALRAADAVAPPDAVDLRLGTTAGSTEIVLDQPGDVVRSGRGRRNAETVRTRHLLVAVTRRERLLESAAQRRVRVEVR